MNRLMTGAIIAVLAVTACAAQAASCDIRANDLQFDAYNSLRPAAVDSVSTILVQCETALAAEMVAYSISVGSGQSGSFSPRTMIGPGETLEYNLYVDSMRTTIWGDGSGGSVTVGGELNLPGQNSSERIIYGRIPPLQSVPPGLYVDSIVISLDF